MITEVKKGKEVRGEIPYYCKWEGKKADYNITIKLDAETNKFSRGSTCECKYFAFYGQSKANKGKELCRHLVKGYGKIIKQPYEKARENLINQGLIHKDHLITR